MEIPLNPSSYVNIMLCFVFVCSFKCYCFQRESGTPSPHLTSWAGEEPPVRPRPLSTCARDGERLPRPESNLIALRMMRFIPGRGRDPGCHPRTDSSRHAHTSSHRIPFCSLFFFLLTRVTVSELYLLTIISLSFITITSLLCTLTLPLIYFSLSYVHVYFSIKHKNGNRKQKCFVIFMFLCLCSSVLFCVCFSVSITKQIM